jgi:hypothetical protein
LCWVSGSWADQLTGLFDDATAQQLTRSSGVADEGLLKHLLDTREAKRETSLVLPITPEIAEERVSAHEQIVGISVSQSDWEPMGRLSLQALTEMLFRLGEALKTALLVATQGRGL